MSPKPNYFLTKSKTHQLLKKRLKPKQSISIKNQEKSTQKQILNFRNAIDVIRDLKNILQTDTGRSPQSSSDSLNKRTIILDGRNVAMAHQSKSVRGINICLEFFQQEHFKVQTVMSDSLASSLAKNQEDRKDLDAMYNSGSLVYSRNGSEIEDRKVILEMAAHVDGVIMSNHNYADLYHQNSNWDSIISRRIIGLAFYNDMLLLPRDPYGRHGPELYSILIKS